MSNRNQDADYGRPAQVMDFVADAILRRIRTAEPAMIEEYDSTTRRAKVKPLINAVKTDRTPLPRASIPGRSSPVAVGRGGHAAHAGPGRIDRAANLHAPVARRLQDELLAIDSIHPRTDWRLKMLLPLPDLAL